MARPRSDTAKRGVLTLRIAEATRDQLVLAAASSGRSLAREIEHRLEESLGGVSSGRVGAAAFPRLLKAIIEDSEAKTGKAFQEDSLTWADVRKRILSEIDARSPLNQSENPLFGILTLQGEFRTARQLLSVIEQEHKFHADTGPEGQRTKDRSHQVDFRSEALTKLGMQLGRVQDCLNEFERFSVKAAAASQVVD